MGNDASPRPGYDYWVSFPGQGRLVDPELQEDGRRGVVRGYVTDLLNERACAFVARPRQRPFALYLAHKAVHPDLFQRQDGTFDPDSLGGYVPAERHRDLYRGATFPAAAERACRPRSWRAPSRRWPRRSPGRSGSPPGAPCWTRSTREPRRRSASARR